MATPPIAADLAAWMGREVGEADLETHIATANAWVAQHLEGGDPDDTEHEYTEAHRHAALELGKFFKQLLGSSATGSTVVGDYGVSYISDRVPAVAKVRGMYDLGGFA